MSFISFEFILYGSIFYVFYPIIGKRARVLYVSLFSLFFYGWWDIWYVPLIFISAIVDYICSLKIYNSFGINEKKRWLAASIVINIGILVYFKYLGFIVTQVSEISGVDLFVEKMLLPIGLSFYTLQTISYTIDVYKKKTIPETDFFVYFLFVSFFPQLVAGPIERSRSLLPQLRNLPTFSFECFQRGVLIALWGGVLKVVVADNIAPFIGNVLSLQSAGFLLFPVSILAMFQVYCDFFGYTLIAQGLAFALGVRLSENFKQPFLAKSLPGFWKTWHISMTRWFTEYVHLEIAKRFPRDPGYSVSAISVMCLVGLWHGASWNFIIFGLVHGVGIRFWQPAARWLIQFDFSRMVRNMFSRISLFVFIALTAPLFMVENLDQIQIVFSQMFSLKTGLPNVMEVNGKFELAIGLSFLALVVVNDCIVKSNRKFNFVSIAHSSSKFQATILSSILVIVIFIFGNFTADDFVYFQF